MFIKQYSVFCNNKYNGDGRAELSLGLPENKSPLQSSQNQSRYPLIYNIFRVNFIFEWRTLQSHPIPRNTFESSGISIETAVNNIYFHIFLHV